MPFILIPNLDLWSSVSYYWDEFHFLSTALPDLASLTESICYPAAHLEFTAVPNYLFVVLEVQDWVPPDRFDLLSLILLFKVAWLLRPWQLISSCCYCYWFVNLNSIHQKATVGSIESYYFSLYFTFKTISMPELSSFATCYHVSFACLLHCLKKFIIDVVVIRRVCWGRYFRFGFSSLMG